MSFSTGCLWPKLACLCLLGATLTQPQAPAERDAAREGVVTATSTFSPSFTASQAVDGQNGTAWLTGVLPPNSMQVEQCSIDLHGAFSVRAVEIVWGSSGGPMPQDLRPRNYTVQVGLDGAAWTLLAPSDVPHVLQGADMEPLVLVGAGSAPARYVRLKVWGSGRNSFYGVAAFRVLARDAPLAVQSPVGDSWLTSGTVAPITWSALPGIPTITLELLNSREDTTPQVINLAANQLAGSYSWSIPAISGQTGRLGVALPSDSIVVGSNYYLRISRPQGTSGRKVTTLVGPIAISGNMARGGQSAATSWDSLSAQPSMAFDGNPGSAWSSDCEMGIGGSSGGDVGEVVQVFLPAPAWVESLRLVWNGPSMPSEYKIWYLPLNAAERTGPGVSGIPDPMADLSMNGGYMDGWVELLDWRKPAGVVDDPDNGRVDRLNLFPALFSNPVAIDVLRMQVPYNWLASCYPLAELEVNGVPLLTVASPIDFSVVKAGEPFTPRWVTPPAATALETIVDGGFVTARFDSDFDVAAAGWVPSNVSGWGICYGQPFSSSSGVVLQDYAANVGSYLWNVPCAPGAQQYYVTFEYSVASNPATEPSEFFAISREPQSPKDVGTDPVLGRSATLVWIPGYRNGAVIESYVVELRRWETSSRREQHTTGNFTFTGWQSELLYVQGAVSQYVLADLTPYTKYTVRLGAVNVVGPGAWSELVDFRTEPDVPDGSRSLVPAMINSNAVNMTWKAPYHNGDLVSSFRLDLKLQDSDQGDLLDSHLVTMVKCRDLNSPNVSAIRLCPRLDEKGYMDCFGVTAPANGNLGTCPRDQWLRHGEACYLRCGAGFRAVGRQPSCAYGVLHSTVVCAAIVIAPPPAPEPPVDPAQCRGTASEVPGSCSDGTPQLQPECEVSDCSNDGDSDTMIPCEWTPAATPACDFDVTTDNSAACPVGCTDTTVCLPSMDVECTGTATEVPASCSDGVSTNQLVCEAVDCGGGQWCIWTPATTPTCDLEAATDGSDSCLAGCDCNYVPPAVVIANGAASDKQLTGNPSQCPGRTVHQTPPGQCPYRDCAANEVRDCNGVCLSPSACTHTGWGYATCAQWGNREAEGDGFCAAAVNEQSSSGYHPNFNCPYHFCEGGDCGLDPLGNGVPCGRDFDTSLLIDPDADLTASCAETPTPSYNMTFIDVLRDTSFVANISDPNIGATNMGLLGGGPLINSSGAFFDGDDAVVLDERQWGSSGQITVSFWMNKFSLFTDDQFEYVVSQNPVAARSTNLQFVIADQSHLKITIVDDNTNRATIRLYDHIVMYERWQHIALTCGIRGLYVFVGGIPVPSEFMTVLSGDINADFGAFTMDGPLHVGSRSDRHPDRFYVGGLASFMVFDNMLNHLQVSCLYTDKWVMLVEESCYDVVTAIEAGDAGVIGEDGSQSFCGPAVDGMQLWHVFDDLVSGVDYTISVTAINEIGGSGEADMRFAARTALMQTVPVLIERSVTKPNTLSVESMLVNLGDGDLHWNVSNIDFIGQIVVSPMGSVVMADGVGLLKMEIESPGLAPGQHRVEITLTSNAATRPGIQVVVVMMSVDSHADPVFSTADGPALAKLTRGRTGYQIFIKAFDLDNEIAAAPFDPFSLRVDPMPVADAESTGNASNSSAATVAVNASAMDWSDWYPTTQPVSTGIVIGFGSGVYRAEYDAPTVPGYFLTSVLLDGVHIKGSPFLTQSVCAVGEYDDETGERCVPCDASMVSCSAEGTLLSNIKHELGVWRSSTFSDQFHWCDNGECLAGVGPACNDGYTGNLCRTCAEGYGTLYSRCIECPEGKTWIIVIVTLALNLLPFLTVTYWMKYHVATRELYRSQRGAIYKIGFNFLQTSSMIPAYQSAFPPILEILFGLQRSLSDFGSSTRMFYSCVVELEPVHSFFAGALMSTGIPAFLAVVHGVLILWNAHQQQFDRANQQILQVLLVLYVAFPTVVRTAGEAFTCTTIDTFSYPVLKSEPAVSCADQPQAFVAVIGVIVGLAIPGIPIVLLALVWRARQSNTLEEELTIWRFGWMHAEYEYVMWEGAVLLRKALLALLPAFFPGAAPQLLYLAATILFFFAILMHALLLPYSGPYAVTAQCELVSLLCSFAIFACCFFREGLGATSDSPTTAVKETDGVAIAIVVMTLFALWFFQAMHKLVGILEGDGYRSGAISWADIQTYFRYSLIPRYGAGMIRKLRHEKRIAPLRGPMAYLEQQTPANGGGKVGASKRKGRTGSRGAQA